MNKYMHRIASLVGVSLLLCALASCSGQPARLSPKAVVAKAYAATTAIQSEHYTITGTISASGEALEIHGEGDFLFPDREQMRIEVSGQTIEMVRIGDKHYLKLPGAAEWQVRELGSEALYQPVEPMDTLGYLQSIAVVSELPDETVAGVLCEHYQGVVDVTQYLAAMESAIAKQANSEIQQGEATLGERLEGSGIAVEVWIGKEDHLVYQMTIDMTTCFSPPALADGPPAEKIQISSVQTIQFSKFNEPLEIRPPF